MDSIQKVLIAGIVFSAIYGVIQLFVRRKERIMLIERGMDAPKMKSEFQFNSTLKFGLFFIGIGVGVLVGNILAVATVLDPEVAYFSMVFLFGGLALILTHYIEKKKVS